jgi:hypothetical protein
MVKSAGALRLGPVARKLINPDRWTGGYPGPPAYVRELDALLHFAYQNGYLERFIPNLESKDRQRDKALNELRLAYLFKSLGFEISEWDPPGANGKIGEFLLSSPGDPSIFVEIKSRGWESELTPAQRDAGLAKRRSCVLAKRSTKWQRRLALSSSKWTRRPNGSPRCFERWNGWLIAVGLSLPNSRFRSSSIFFAHPMLKLPRPI